MDSNYDNHNAVNDVIRLLSRCKHQCTPTMTIRKIADDENTECNYRRMLHIILGKAEELFKRESDNQVQKSEAHNSRKLKRKSVVEEDNEPKHYKIRNTKAKSTDESDDDVVILEGDELLQNLRSFVPSETFHNSMEEDADFLHLGRSSGSKSEFREKVLDVLGQPFDKHELKRLREAVRNESYHQYYPDLESKLKRCRYKRWKCLNILRGFFFWLQNVCQEGSFKPWKDGQCLAVEPSSPLSSPPPPSIE